MKTQITALEARPLVVEKPEEPDSAVESDFEIENQVVQMEIRPTP